MSSQRVMITCLLLLVTSVTDVMAKSICDVEFVSPVQTEKVLVDDKKLIADRSDGQYVAYFDEKASVAWAFTTELNSSHPSVICRKIVIENGAYHIKMDVRCEGAKQSCDKLVANFDERNKRTIESLK